MGMNLLNNYAKCWAHGRAMLNRSRCRLGDDLWSYDCSHCAYIYTRNSSSVSYTRTSFRDWQSWVGNYNRD